MSRSVADGDECVTLVRCESLEPHGVGGAVGLVSCMVDRMDKLVPQHSRHVWGGFLGTQLLCVLNGVV